MFNDISVERKKKLYELAEFVGNYIIRKNHPGNHNLFKKPNYTRNYIAKDALYYLKNKYKFVLNEIEEEYFKLIIMVPNDLAFYKTCKVCKKENTISKSSVEKYDFDRIAKIYGIDPYSAQKRYKLMLDSFRNNIIEKEDVDKVIEKTF